ncbi:MAG: hypothetical protein U1E76_20745 [Planctomycetota bacterium]
MKGSLIVLLIGAVVAAFAAVALWPSAADLERATHSLERKLARIDDELKGINDDLLEILRFKWANNLKKKLDLLRNQATAIRADGKATAAAFDASITTSKATALQKLKELDEAAVQLGSDSSDLRARTTYIRGVLRRIEPLRNEARELRAKLTRRADELQDQELIRRLKAAIDASSRAEDLVQQALERLPASLDQGKVMAQTAENELEDALAEMRRLAGP